MTGFDLSARLGRAALQGVADETALSTDEGAVDSYARAIWSGLTEPGDGVAGLLVQAVGPVTALEAVLGGARSADAIRAADAAEVTGDQFAKGLARWVPRLDLPALSAGWEVARRHGVRLIQPGRADWPAQIEDLGPHAPLVLWVRGDPSVLTGLGPSVALVGARAATRYGEQITVDFAADLAAHGVAIVSGGAYGIDGAAHRTTVLAGGVTVALLAGGVDRAYPAGHAHLLTQIVATGAVLSEVPCGSAPTKWRFLQRNRLIAALSDATVVVEAGWRSGALNTASHAASLGRPLGAVPGPVTSAASVGCHRLLRDSDARCVTTPDEVRELLGADAPVTASDGSRTDDATRVRDALSARMWRDSSDLARRTGMAIADVEAMLGFFRLDGDVDHDARGWRLVADSR